MIRKLPKIAESIGKSKRKIMVLMLCQFFIVLLFSGCSKLNVTGVEVGKSLFIRAIGVDKATDGSDKVRLTFVAEKLAQAESNDPKSGEEAAFVYTSEGRTVFEAKRAIHAYTYREPFVGHTSLLIVGQEIASDNIMKYLDYFITGQEFRLNAKILVVKDTTAEDFIKRSNISKEFIADKLMSLIESASALSVSKDMTLSDILPMFASESGSAYLPCVGLVNVSDKNDQDADKMDISLNGFALFDKNKLCRYVTDNTARGINWLNQDVKSGILVVKDSSGENVSLEIITADTKIKPKLKDGNLSVEIAIEAQTNIGGQYSSKNLLTKEEINYLQEAQDILILQEAQAALDIAQTEGLDVFGIGNKVYHKYPLKWEAMEKDWKQIYQSTPIVIHVKSSISGVYLMNQPVQAE